jgi:N-acetylglucosaminyldiphosphoundecaprenol N-acetyl-beta-D-mannosaminyltransferase
MSTVGDHNLRVASVNEATGLLRVSEHRTELRRRQHRRAVDRRAGERRAADRRNQPRHVEIEGLAFDRVSEPLLLERVRDALVRGTGGWIITANLDITRKMRRNSELSRLAHEATLVVADGMPLVWASRLNGVALPERVAGSDLVWSLPEMLAELGVSVFLVGGEPGTADEAARRLNERCAGLRVVGTLCPPHGFERHPEAMAQITDVVAGSGAQLVFVGLGFPKQEMVIRELRRAMPEAWFVGVGVSFSFMSGAIPRAPRWMQRVGLEWLHRLAHEPRRLAARYLGDLPFAGRLLFNQARRRFQRGADASAPRQSSDRRSQADRRARASAREREREPGPVRAATEDPPRGPGPS